MTTRFKQRLGKLENQLGVGPESKQILYVICQSGVRLDVHPDSAGRRVSAHWPDWLRKLPRHSGGSQRPGTGEVFAGAGRRDPLAEVNALRVPGLAWWRSKQRPQRCQD